MSHEFIQVKVGLNMMTIARTAIATIEKEGLGTKIVLNIKDKQGYQVEIITSSDYSTIVRLLE